VIELLSSSPLEESSTFIPLSPSKERGREIILRGALPL